MTRVTMIEALQLAAQFCEEHVDADVPKVNFDKYNKTERPDLAAEKLSRIRQVADDIVRDSRLDEPVDNAVTRLRSETENLNKVAAARYNGTSGGMALKEAFIEGYSRAIFVLGGGE